MSDAVEKTCSRCGHVGPLEDFCKDKRNDDGRAGWCRPCQRLVNRHYMRRIYDSATSDRRRKYPDNTVRDPEKTRAGRVLRETIRNGKLERPSHCQGCGEPHHNIHAHHDDYSKPLNVAWLCPPCHGLRHRIPDEHTLEGRDDG